MLSTKSELKDEVREMTGYTSTKVLSTDGLDTAYGAAQRHLRIEKSLAADYDWYATDNHQAREALFWYTCLFSKVQTGELDSQSLQAGAVDMKTLLAKGSNQVTTWYRNAVSAKRAFGPSKIMQSTSPSRDDRDYQTDTADLGSNTGGGSGDDVDL